MFLDEKMERFMIKSFSTATVMIATGVLLTGCAGQMTKSVQTENSYIIYDVKGEVNRQQLLDSVTTAVKTNMTEVVATRDVPPATLSEKPMRFVMTEPFKGSNIGALMASSGQTLKIPSCDDAILTMKSSDKSMSNYGEKQTFFLCVQPYQSGHTISIYSTFSKTSGGLDPKALGAALASSLVGDSSQYIPRTMNAVKEAAEKTGATVSTMDSYIPDVYKGAFYNKTAGN
jgi:hypothetical protein